MKDFQLKQVKFDLVNAYNALRNLKDDSTTYQNLDYTEIRETMDKLTKLIQDVKEC